MSNFNCELFKTRVLKSTKSKTQKEAAERLNIPQSTFSLWCTGKQIPPIQDLLNISDQLNCGIDYLMGRDSAAGFNPTLGNICRMLVALDKAVHFDHSADADGKTIEIFVKIPEKQRYPAVVYELNKFMCDYFAIRDSNLPDELKEKCIDGLLNKLPFPDDTFIRSFPPDPPGTMPPDEYFEYF